MPEKRILLKNCGKIDPGDIQSYEGQGGFKALEKALGMSPDAVIAEVKASGLRGRRCRISLRRQMGTGQERPGGGEVPHL